MRNVEIKAKIEDISDFLRKANEISDQPESVLIQTDTYFKIPNGRLKLRLTQGEKTQLIHYDRSDTEGPKLSSYSKVEFESSTDAEGLKRVLESSLGVVGVVKKKRHLLMNKRTRIHVDEVENLGFFMELEVMLGDGETVEEGQEVAEGLMRQLGVSKQDLISGSYINMLTG